MPKATKQSTQDTRDLASMAGRLRGRDTAVPADRIAFAEKYIRLNRQPWSLQDHEYLRAIMLDQSDHRVLQKAAQMAASTEALIELLQLGMMGYNVGYYLTDANFMRAYVQARLDPLINGSDVLAAAVMDAPEAGEDMAAGGAAARRLRTKGADNLLVKRIGDGHAWFMGLQKRKDVKSVDLDCFFLDEVDEVDQDLAAWLDDRLLHSRLARRLELSQPSVPDWGIAERYEASNQQVYLHTCPRCRTEQVLEEAWPANLVKHTDGQWRIVCLKCGARIRRGRAQWVARHPDRDVSGYRLSQLFGPVISDHQLGVRWQAALGSRRLMENFVISKLGLPYPGDRQPLSEEVLNQATGDWLLGLEAFLARIPEARVRRPLVLAGVDVGDVIHAAKAVWHEERLDVCALEVINGDWDALWRWLRDVDFFVIDAMPYKSDAVRLVRRDGMNGMISYLNAESQTVTIAEKHHAHPIRVVNDDRTSAIDEMAGAVIGRVLRLPSNRLDVVQTAKQHLKRLVKDLDPRSGKMKYKDKVENHFGMTLTYLWLAHQIADALHLGPGEPLGDLDSFSGGRGTTAGMDGDHIDWL